LTEANAVLELDMVFLLNGAFCAIKCHYGDII
jgi:hypothetical protein